MVKIIIADDQILFSNMLKTILETHESFEVAACAKNGEEALFYYKKHLPDICLFDVQMPGTDGIWALKEIKSAYPESKIIMLTTFCNDENIIRAYQNDADGYLLKDVAPDVLIRSIECAALGICVVSKGIQIFLSDFLRDDTHFSKMHSSGMASSEEFSARDLEIMGYIAKGFSNKEIAVSMNYSEGTVRNCISAILSLTGLKDRTQIALFAIKNRLV